MNSRRKVKIDSKAGWKLSRLIDRNHLSIDSSFLTSTERTSTSLQTEELEGPVESAWSNLELAKAYADNLRNRII